MSSQSKKTGTKHHKVWKTIKPPNLWIIGIEEREVTNVETGNIFNKTVEEKFSHLKNEIPTKVKEAYRTSNR